MLKKTIDLGLADFGLWHGRRTRAIVHIELDSENVLHITADIRGVGYGQTIDEIAKAYKGNELAEKIVNWWRKYHLNDMHAGTQKQEEALNKAGITNWADDYDICCKYLESIGLLYDNGYKFGSAWLKEEILSDDLQEIKEFLA